MQLTLTGTTFPAFDVDDHGRCEQAVVQQCAKHGHEWSLHHQDKASLLLRAIIERSAYDGVGRLLQGGSRGAYMLLVGPWCGIANRAGEQVFPELRWSDVRAGIVCYRAGLSSPLTTKQFEEHREQLEEIWQGPVSILRGGDVRSDIPPGCIVVQPAPKPVLQIAIVPPAPRSPLPLPQKIPLVLPPYEGGWE